MVMICGVSKRRLRSWMWSYGDVVNRGGMAVVAEKISSFIQIRATEVFFRTAGFAELSPTPPNHNHDQCLFQCHKGYHYHFSHGIIS